MTAHLFVVMILLAGLGLVGIILAGLIAELWRNR